MEKISQSKPSWGAVLRFLVPIFVFVGTLRIYKATSVLLAIPTTGPWGAAESVLGICFALSCGVLARCLLELNLKMHNP